MLHVHSGDCAAEALRSAGVEGVYAVWTDLLMQGPLRPGRGAEAYRAERAAHLSLSTGGARTPSQCLDMLRRQDEALAQWLNHAETVLWVDACLYDQAILVRLLCHFGALPDAVGRLRLVCVDHHPEVREFHGLGQLTPALMAALLPLRTAVSQAQVDLARTAWKAMCAETPREIEALCRQPTEALPCLKPALRRWLEQYPSTTNGLCRLQQETLDALRTHGEQDPVQLFARVSIPERPAFFGDTFLWQLLNDMAFSRVPLLWLDGHEPLPLWGTTDIGRRRLGITDAGKSVAAGKADAIALNSIDRWLGGVHLRGRDTSPWRWNRQAAVAEPRA